MDAPRFKHIGRSASTIVGVALVALLAVLLLAGTALAAKPVARFELASTAPAAVSESS
jgi:hypothetical protein